ncbi:GNAT family N-acetyltransferase [Cytobacillus sp. NCCP-133]|uniref:GNAT family N-acetyltransferase n=1 Tax=Cytobacillus sp. NCCP-133 TaxID=766848 RepID=UPI0022328819|nr:GNAT family N-acetyltransferase [Cytobacillus sp. NCCP-133]GLB59888.1 N-acetyltransferase [Cytobacillus sp. NCCP-133]
MSADILKEENRYFINDESGNMAAEITFVPSGDSQITIDHTYVSDSLRGQGVAGKLVEKVVQEARKSGLKIVPACSYAKALFERKSEYQDVLAK